MASPHQLSPAELGWAAGLLDGEGCLLVDAWGSPVITVEMTHRATIYRLRRLLGGTVTTYASTRPGHRRRYRWRLAARDAPLTLLALLPHNVTKRKEALVLLHYLSQRAHNGRRRSGRELALVRTTRARLSALKREG